MFSALVFVVKRMVKLFLAIHPDAPVTTIFAGVSFSIWWLNKYTFAGDLIPNLALDGSMGWGAEWYQYYTFFTSAVSHQSRQHLIGNVMLFLPLSYAVEMKFGWRLLPIYLLVAAITGIFHITFMPNIRLIGLSGIVFCSIALCLCSFPQTRRKGVGLGLVLLGGLFIWPEMNRAFFPPVKCFFFFCREVEDGISQTTHIIGAITGICCSYIFHPQQSTPVIKRPSFTLLTNIVSKLPRIRVPKISFLNRRKLLGTNPDINIARKPRNWSFLPHSKQEKL